MQPIPRGRLLLALILAAAFAGAVSALAQLSQDPTWRPRMSLGGHRQWSRTPPKSARHENIRETGGDLMPGSGISRTIASA